MLGWEMGCVGMGRIGLGNGLGNGLGWYELGWEMDWEMGWDELGWVGSLPNWVGNWVWMGWDELGWDEMVFVGLG